MRRPLTLASQLQTNQTHAIWCVRNALMAIILIRNAVMHNCNCKRGEGWSQFEYADAVAMVSGEQPRQTRARLGSSTRPFTFSIPSSSSFRCRRLMSTMLVATARNWLSRAGEICTFFYERGGARRPLPAIISRIRVPNSIWMKPSLLCVSVSMCACVRTHYLQADCLAVVM